MHPGLRELINKHEVRSREEADQVIAKHRAQQNTIVPYLVSSSDNKKVAEFALATWAVENGVSWRAFTTGSWKKVLQTLNCDAGLGDSLRRNVFPRMARLMRKYLQLRLEGCCAVSATSDGWTRLDLSCVSFTISWTDRSSLDVITVPIAAYSAKSGRAEDIVALWNRACSSTNIPDSVVIGAMTTDSGANFKRAAKDFVGDDSRWGCLCHALNNIGDRATTAAGATLFVRIETLVTWLPKPLRRAFKNSQLANGRTLLKFVYPVATRWFTKLDMADRYLKLADDFEQFLAANSGDGDVATCRKRLLSAQDLSDLRTILALLRPFQDKSTLAECDSKPTLCYVPQWLDELRQSIKIDPARDSQLAQRWKSALQTECKPLFDLVFETPSLPLRAACFHPHLGTLPWITDMEKKDAVWEKLVDDIVALLGPVAPLPAATTLLHKQTSEADVRGEVARLRELMEKNHDLLVRTFQNDDIQKFWKENNTSCNALLVDAARFFMSIQASSASSERLWSSATFTANRRPQLSPANFEATIVLHGCLKMSGQKHDALFQALMKLEAEEVSKK